MNSPNSNERHSDNGIEGLQRIIAEMAMNIGKLINENTRLHHELERGQFSFDQADSRLPLHLSDFGEVVLPLHRNDAGNMVIGPLDAKVTNEDLERRNGLGKQFTKAFARINTRKAEPTLINNCARHLFDLELQHSKSCLCNTALLLHTLADQDDELQQLKKEKNQAELDSKVRRQMLDNQKRHIELLTQEKHQLQKERDEFSNSIHALQNRVNKFGEVKVRNIGPGYVAEYGPPPFVPPLQIFSATFVGLFATLHQRDKEGLA